MSAPTTGNDYGPCVADKPSWELGRVCTRHGGKMGFRGECQTIQVLHDVRAERTRQFAKYGTNADIEDGTGPETRWLGGLADWAPADRIAREIRNDYEDYEEETGKPTWVHLVLEEVAEAFTEKDPQRLRAELLQVAALCVSWIEKIDAR